MNPWLLALESVLLYLLPPVLIMAGLLPKFSVMPALWAGFLYAAFVLRRDAPELLRFHFDRRAFRRILIRFVPLAALIVLFVWHFFPRLLFSLPRRDPGLWLLVLLLYPPLSALAQEVVFRAFFSYRFGTLISNRGLFILCNALLFAYIHTVFGNPVAVLFTFIGGVLFMSTYLKTRSVTMSTIEHALYGNLVFTLGIGQFFYRIG